ncbi:MAG: VOC family protein [Erysipelotrichaceae bacterium]|nr:VOC family protein [Erysipelotrichaceae bacterium]
MSKYVKGAHHINLRPNHENYDACMKFYTEDLGLEMTSFWNKMRGDFNSRNCFIECGNGTTLEVCECETGTTDAGIIQHFSLEVNSVRELMTHLKEKGYTFSNSKGQPTDDSIIDATVCGVHMNIFFVKSPSGELVEFLEIVKD